MSDVLPYFPLEPDGWSMRMDARALAVDRLIEVDPARYHAELAHKEALLAGDHRYYCQALPGADALQWEAVEHLLRTMARHDPRHFSLAVDEEGRWTWTNHLLGTQTSFAPGDPRGLPLAPLDWLGRQVQEDLLILDGTADGTPLVVGHLLCASSWCLDDKIGRSFLEIHDAVPLFAASIGGSADLLMRRLKPGRPVGRVNWSIATTDRLNLAPATRDAWLPTREGITRENAGARAYLRLERQTLSRLPRTGAILFTIRVYVAPVAEVASDPERRRRLRAALAGMPPATRAYKGMDGYAGALIGYLDQTGAGAHAAGYNG